MTIASSAALGVGDPAAASASSTVIVDSVRVARRRVAHFSGDQHAVRGRLGLRVAGVGGARCERAVESAATARTQKFVRTGFLRENCR
jgi:hypothetical protein